MTRANIIFDTDAQFAVRHADSQPTVHCGDVSLFLHSRCQLERLAVAIDKALHGEAVLADAHDVGGEA